MFCQRIEYDIKVSYACMLDGNFNKNYEQIKNETLGQTVKMLEELDNCDEDPYLSKNDYNLLRKITKIRNHLVHKTYCEFIYSDEKYERDFNKEAQKLYNEHQRLKNLCEIIQKVRFDIAKKFDRL